MGNLLATRDELEHEVRRLRSENGDLRAALSRDAEALEQDLAEAERRASRFWFAAWKEAKRQCRQLHEELARLKEKIRG